MPLDDVADEIIREENPTAEAVKSLINVKNRTPGKASEIELKTDLSPDEIKIHSVLAVLNDSLEMSAKDFATKCILGELIERKERKSLSKNRLSRSEIVNVARQPDQNQFDVSAPNENFIKRFFTPRNKQ